MKYCLRFSAKQLWYLSLRNMKITFVKILFSGIWRSVDRQLVTKFSEQPVCPVLKIQAWPLNMLPIGRNVGKQQPVNGE